MSAAAGTAIAVEPRRGDGEARLAIVAFAVMFALSALVIAPLIAGGTAQPAPPGVQLPAGHDSHHAG